MSEENATDPRITHVLGLLSATRTIVIANAEAGHASYSGAIALLDEMERCIRSFASADGDPLAGE